MVGEHHVVISSKRLKYEFTLRRNVTILKGDSGTGKTTMINMIKAYNKSHNKHIVDIQCDKACVVIEGSNWKKSLSEVEDSIVFIDEDNKFIGTNEFASCVKYSSNYYVLITRQFINMIPYSIREVYELKTIKGKGEAQENNANTVDNNSASDNINISDNVNTSRQYYITFSPIYCKGSTIGEKFKPDIIITEDSGSGNEFFSEICNQQGKKCESANGKDKAVNKIGQIVDKNVLIIVDGSAFGVNMDYAMKKLLRHKNYALYAPESFEWLILKSGVLNSKDIANIIEHPENHIDSKEFISWERFFTTLLKETTHYDKCYKYKKEKLAGIYKTNASIDSMLKGIRDKVDI